MIRFYDYIPSDNFLKIFGKKRNLEKEIPKQDLYIYGPFNVYINNKDKRDFKITSPLYGSGKHLLSIKDFPISNLSIPHKVSIYVTSKVKFRQLLELVEENKLDSEVYSLYESNLPFELYD